MSGISGFDHIAIAVPDLDAQVERLTGAFGMTVQGRSEGYALLADPVSGFKIEMNQSDGGGARFRHLGFRTADVDGEHKALLDAGMAEVEAPRRRDFARMRTSFLREANGLEFQLVKYDSGGDR
jgi:catechol 2,3-dioxygenase-like lactoylglutathione lyase family enzyme